MRIEDGGANDADETADGIIKQLSGIAVLDINSSLPDEQTSSISVGPNTVNANGDSEAKLTVTVVNAAKLGLLGLELELIGCQPCDDVLISAFVDEGDGTYTATLVARASADGGSQAISVHVNHPTARITLGPVEYVWVCNGACCNDSRGGGCSVGPPGGPKDATWLVLLMLSVWSIWRRNRPQRVLLRQND